MDDGGIGKCGKQGAVNVQEIRVEKDFTGFP